MSQKQVLVSRPARQKTRPPGISLTSFLLNLPEAIRDPLVFLQNLSKKHGSITRIGNLIYILNEPEYTEQVLVGTNRGFIKGINQSSDKPRTAAGNGLVVSEGDYWLRQRRLAQPAFHQRRIAEYAATMVNYTQTLIKSWQVGQIYELQKEFSQLTLNIAGKTLFNTDMTDQADVVARLLVTFANNPVIPSPFPTKKQKQIKKAQQELDEVLYKLIAERRASGDDKGDLLSMFLAARDENNEQMNDRQIRDELITMIIAGHETTALTLTWLFYLLATHPGVTEQLQTELSTVLAGKAPTVSDLPNLRYCNAIVKETLRLYPAAWGLARRLTASAEIGGYLIKKGKTVVLSPWLTQREERYFSQPERFQPERWLTNLEKQLPKYAYFPFGGGPRVCIGQSFAQMELMVVLATIGQQCRLELVPNQLIKAKAGVTLRPTPIQIVVKKVEV